MSLGKQVVRALSKSKIELITGCMFSGKTTELIDRINALAPGTKIVTLKPAIDDRYSNTDLVTHNGRTAQARTVEHSNEIAEQAGEAEVVVIDEIHFFDDAIVQTCQQLARRGVRVICSGLDRDMWGDIFAHVEQLSRLAETTLLTTTCKACGGSANRTHRTVPLMDDNLVGGPDEFEPRCENCFRPPTAPKPAHTPGLAERSE